MILILSFSLSKLNLKLTHPAQNFEAEQLCQRNFNISQILNPMGEFFTALEQAQNYIQLL